jgi:hypothetical protein
MIIRQKFRDGINDSNHGQQYNDTCPFPPGKYEIRFPIPSSHFWLKIDAGKTQSQVFPVEWRKKNTIAEMESTWSGYLR